MIKDIGGKSLDSSLCDIKHITLSNYDEYKHHYEETKQYGFNKQHRIFITAEE